MNEELKSQLLGLPKVIEDKEIELLKLKDSLEVVKSTISFYELQIKQKVQEESEGNKNLSNETKRNIEVSKQLSASLEYQSLKQSLTEHSNTFEIIKLRLDRLKREFQSALVISRLGD